MLKIAHLLFFTMALELDILGAAGSDNALLVRVNTGQSVHRLLFDCGEGCLRTLSVSEIHGIDHLFFSHLHMDHVAGFDSFFRCVYARNSEANTVWGPPATSRIMHHRFRGFMWNLHQNLSAKWYVCDVHPESVATTRFEAKDAFRTAHDDGSRPRDAVILDGPAYSVEAYAMDHLTPSLAYVVREAPRVNVDSSRLARLGFSPGPWLQQVKTPRSDVDAVVVEGVSYPVNWLREELLVEKPGESAAYLTDFLLDEEAEERLVRALAGCTTLVCESQYRHADLELARRNYHLTAKQAAELACRSGVGELILFHVSDRYGPEGWNALLEEARAVFPNTRFPAQWVW